MEISTGFFQVLRSIKINKSGVRVMIDIICLILCILILFVFDLLFKRKTESNQKNDRNPKYMKHRFILMFFCAVITVVIGCLTAFLL